ncbi:MAG: B12-binding domain-containing radical SAM protein [Candidatus Geothermincolia bacterium]
MKALLISDSWGFGLIETKPFPLWQRRFLALRNKALIVPEYGVMYIAAWLKARGKRFDVMNLVLDEFDSPSWYREAELPAGEPEPAPEELSGSAIATDESARSMALAFERRLRELSPDVIFFPVSIYYVALHARELMARARRILPGAAIVAGGVYSSMHAQELLEEGNADYVVRGEGEWTALELFEALETRSGVAGISGLSYRDGAAPVHNPARERERDIDIFPHLFTVSEEFRIVERYRLLRELNPFDDYIPGGGFLTSRGCPEECTFCLDPAVWGRKTRFHSPRYVREVVQYCSETFRQEGDAFYFGDATFALNRKRLFKLLPLIQDIPYAYNIQTRADSLTPAVLNGLAETNFASVAIGAESLNDDVLRDVVRKRVTSQQILDATRSVRSHGMKPLLTFIAGLPGESRASIERTLETLRREKIDTATFFPLVVFKGTALYGLFQDAFNAEEREGLRLNAWSEEYCFVNDEFPTMQSLIDFAEEANNYIRS